MRKISSSTEMSFIKIIETYPDEYVLVRITALDHNKGKEAGVALYASTSRDELSAVSRHGSIVGDSIILEGENLLPVLGGLL